MSCRDIINCYSLTAYKAIISSSRNIKRKLRKPSISHRGRQEHQTSTMRKQRAKKVSVKKPTQPTMYRSYRRPVLGGTCMPEQVGGLGDLKEESARQEHVAVLVGQRAQVVELSSQLSLELLEGPAQDFSDLLSVLSSSLLLLLFICLFTGAGKRGVERDNCSVKWRSKVAHLFVLEIPR